MKKEITIEEIKKIASLAHIDITDEEAKKYAIQIAEILEYVELLDEVDIKGETFKSQSDFVNVFREDITKESLTQEQALQNRKKQSKNGYLVISSVLDQN